MPARKQKVKEKATEERIFEAARAVFYENGFDGARMQEIARRARINHSLLHYYFRSKGKLFDTVFRKAAFELIPPVLEILRRDLPLLEKIDSFVDCYVAMIYANPHLPAFILQELRRNPDALRQFAGEAAGGVFAELRAEIERAASRGKIRSIRPEHLFANVIAMCVFPVIAQPMLQTVFDIDGAGYDGFLVERGEVVKTFIRNALVP